jgi:hypothetical protein
MHQRFFHLSDAARASARRRYCASRPRGTSWPPLRAPPAALLLLLRALPPPWVRAVERTETGRVAAAADAFSEIATGVVLVDT